MLNRGQFDVYVQSGALNKVPSIRNNVEFFPTFFIFAFPILRIFNQETVEHSDLVITVNVYFFFNFNFKT